MEQERTENIMTRIISTTFVIVALAVFKPFGLDAWQWQAYAHLFSLWVWGVCICMVTDLILKYIVGMPRTDKHGANYIIRRNLWFQLINTPLIAFVICLYRHFVLSDRVEGNQLSFTNFLETLAIIAFCSFAIGLYWRFKFRSRYLAAELEETRQLNEQLQKVNHSNSLHDPASEPETIRYDSTIILTGTTNETVTLQVADLLYIETVGNYVKVYHLSNGLVRTDMLRATSKQMEDELMNYPMIIRCHRAFLVNLGQVDQIVSKTGSSMQLLIKHSHDSIPVSRSNMSQIKEAIKVITKRVRIGLDTDSSYRE